MLRSNKDKGFTIIEVVLVLAIAGLIFLTVFLALPALQKSQRDNARRQDVGNVVAALQSYLADNNAVPAVGNTTFASYYASKNYVVRLTQAIHEEMRRDNKNVKVSVLCPGPVKTNFNNVADVKFCIRGLDPKFVARYAVDMTMKGKMIITPGFEMKAVSFFRHFAPEKLLTRISYNVQMKKNGIK